MEGNNKYLNNNTRSIKFLLLQLPSRYIGPLVSKQHAAKLRKRALAEGTFGRFVPNEGGWDPAWDEPRKIFITKPAKGHIRERTRETRYAFYTEIFFHHSPTIFLELKRLTWP